jgi:hypothetical protein
MDEILAVTCKIVGVGVGWEGISDWSVEMFEHLSQLVVDLCSKENQNLTIKPKEPDWILSLLLGIVPTESGVANAMAENVRIWGTR